MITRYSVVPLLLISAFAVSEIEAQRYSSSAYRGRSRSRLYTPYFNNYGTYGTSGYGGYGLGTSPYTNPYRLSPYLNYSFQEPRLPPVSGPIERYSDVEYGQIVQMAIAAARRNRPVDTVDGPRPTIVEVTTGTEAGAPVSYMPVSTEVSDVLDRAILLLPTGEEMRLRGVSTPSTTDTNDVSRLYAREAIQTLRNLVQGKEIYVVLDEPLRDGSGRLLGTVFLEDGTELNKYMLEMGYGSLKAEDFAPGVEYTDLALAQQTAREGKKGIWSGGY